MKTPINIQALTVIPLPVHMIIFMNILFLTALEKITNFLEPAYIVQFILLSHYLTHVEDIATG